MASLRFWGMAAVPDSDSDDCSENREHAGVRSGPKIPRGTPPSGISAQSRFAADAAIALLGPASAARTSCAPDAPPPPHYATGAARWVRIARLHHRRLRYDGAGADAVEAPPPPLRRWTIPRQTRRTAAAMTCYPSRNSVAIENRRRLEVASAAAQRLVHRRGPAALASPAAPRRSSATCDRS